MARLIVIKGPDEGRQFDLPAGEPVTIGRDRQQPAPSCTTPRSRRRHAEFARPERRRSASADVGQRQRHLRQQPAGPRRPAAARRPHPDRARRSWSSAPPAAERANGTAADLASQIRLISPPGRGASRRPSSRPSARPRAAASWPGPSRPGPVAQDPAGQPRASCTRPPRPSATSSTWTSCSDRILELIFHSIQADRGCIMLPQPGRRASSSPRPSACATAANRQEKITVSRTIMDYVLREKQGVLSPTPPATSGSPPARASSGSASARSSACR